MSGNLPLGAEFDSRAPWNELTIEKCTECGADMDVTDSGRYRGVNWDNYQCSECGYELINEPNWDDIYEQYQEDIRG